MVNVHVICCSTHFKVASTFLQHTNYNIWCDWTIGVMCTQYETVITMNCTEYIYIYITAAATAVLFLFPACRITKWHHFKNPPWLSGDVVY